MSTSHVITEKLNNLRARQAALITRNVRIIDGARPRGRSDRMQQVIARTKPLRDLEERLERDLRQATNDETRARIEK
jgi:hypothetical protein